MKGFVIGNSVIHLPPSLTSPSGLKFPTELQQLRLTKYDMHTNIHDKIFQYFNNIYAGLVCLFTGVRSVLVVNAKRISHRDRV